MADNNQNSRVPIEHTKDIIEELQKPQDWSQYKVQQKFKELGFDFPTNDEQLEQFNEKFRNYPYKLDAKKIDPIKIINSIK